MHCCRVVTIAVLPLLCTIFHVNAALITLPVQHVKLSAASAASIFYQKHLDPVKTTSTPSTPHAMESTMHLGNGVHTVEVYIGNQKQVLIVDTGSGDTALPCAECRHCGPHHSDNPFVPTHLTTNISCTENKDLGLQKCTSCRDTNCIYGESYVEGSHWEARKVRDKIQFEKSPSLSSSFDIIFGCIYKEYGTFETQEADGILGMSREADALFIQFYNSGAIEERVFSQCISETGGTMALGGVDLSLNTGDIMYTPLRNNGYTYWTVTMESVSVGPTTLPVDASIYNAQRGTVLDSGTTYIYLPTAVQASFTREWKNQAGEAYISGRTYVLSKNQLLGLPTVCFHFKDAAELCVLPEQYMAVSDTSDDSVRTATIYFKDFAHATILGAMALRHHNIVYDIENSRIGIASADCNKAGSQAAISLVAKDSSQTNTVSVMTGAVIMVLTLVAVTALYSTRRQQQLDKYDDQYQELTDANNSTL